MLLVLCFILAMAVLGLGIGLNKARHDKSILQGQLDEARKTVQAQKRLFASINHELRNALNGVIGMSEIIHDELDPKKDEMCHNLSRKVCEAGSYALEIANEILDAIKIETGQFKLRPREFHLSSALSIVENIARSLENRNNNHFEFKYTGDYLLQTDPYRLKQVLINLVSNSMKFTQNGAVTVMISHDEQSKELRLQVKDTGRGIPQHHLENIFQMYSQVQENDQEIGSGMGLSIVQSLVHAMGGTISVDSQEGVGTTFTIILNYIDYIHTSEPNKQAFVLLVDDDEDIRYHMAEVLEEHGITSVHAENGAIALQLMRQHRPDVIVTDLMMPIMGGRELIQKTQELYPDVDSIIVSSGVGSQQVDDQYREKYDFISKPFDPYEFLDLVLSKLNKEKKSVANH